MSEEKVVLVDQDGVPTGVVDTGEIDRAGAKLAYQLAFAATGGGLTVAGVLREAQQTFPVETFSYVALVALQVLADNITGPALTLAGPAGGDLKSSIRNTLTDLLS